MLSFSQMAELDPTTAGSKIPVINFRALLAMKLYALKDRVARQDKDLIDIRSLLSYGFVRITDDEFRDLCERYAGSGAYDLVKMNP